MENRFSRRVRSIAVSAIKQMPLHARAVPDAVSLGQGIPSMATPEYIRARVVELLQGEDAIGKYSLQPGVTELKQEVARIVAQKAGRPVDAEREIFISAGAMEALFTALVSIVDEGDEVILFDPGYASHIEQVLFAGGRPVYVPLREEQGWAMCRDSFAAAITSRTRAIVLSNPSNPTGHLFSRADLELIAAAARRHDLYIVADETYDFLVYDDAPYYSMTGFKDVSDRVMACYSFSKEYAMTGWRVGYLYAPPEIIEQALKVHDAAVICAPTISQFAALAALQGRPSGSEPGIKEVLAQRRDLICRRLDKLGDLFSYTKPAGAYYVLPKYHKTQLNSQEFAMKLLHEGKVTTIPGRAFGPQGENHIRMSFGGTEDQINLAFDRIEEWNRKL